MRFIVVTVVVGLVAGRTLAQPPVPASPEQELTIRLPVSAWNVVVAGLMELPMKLSQPVLLQLETQAKTQMTPSEPGKK